MIKKYRLKKTNKFNEWTRQFNSSRQLWALYSSERQKCFDNARIRVDKSMYKWRCFYCEEFFEYTCVQCDHIIPIGNSQPQTKDEFLICFEKLHVASDKLQVLCITCHLEKTNKELAQKRGLK